MGSVTMRVFWAWDQIMGDRVAAPGMGTVEAATSVQGEVVEGPAKAVDHFELDGNQLYSEKIVLSIFDRDQRVFQRAVETDDQILNPLIKVGVDLVIVMGLCESQKCFTHDVEIRIRVASVGSRVNQPIQRRGGIRV